MKPTVMDMEPYLIERRPSWWLLYVVAGVMVALVALVETSVADDRARVTLEIAVVVTVFALMLRWIRANRGRIELAEAARTHTSAVETALTNGQPGRADSGASRGLWQRRPLGGRRPA